MQEPQLHEVLRIDLSAEIRKICERLRETLATRLNRRGFVVAMSGGIDSSVCAALCVEAIGVKKVFGILLPERDSSSSSESRGQMLAEHLGIEYVCTNIAPTLEAIGCYEWRDAAIKAIFPEYGEGWKNKIAVAGGTAGRINYFNLVVQAPGGEIQTKRLPHKAYLQIVAATNFKQRIRKTLEYFHADRLNFAVVGTPNRVEYDQGFFVKNGDGSADVKPIAHLYKTQVYAIARHMGLPEEICSATPTTDTYSMPQGQDEFYYGLPYHQMDIALWAHNNGKSATDLARLAGIGEDLAAHALKDIDNKRRTTAMLHWPALTLEKVAGPLNTPPTPAS
jgi:NAD+ synthase